ncbi:MAG: methionine adenosyltransferase [Calditrichia bacterium]
MKKFLFTSESVASGHPDKISDAISDAIVDAIFSLPGDVSKNRAAIETLVTTNTCILAGEVKIPENQKIDYESIARKKIRELGYTEKELKFDDSCKISVNIHQQSPEIAMGVDTGGAGDQGMMFGFATNETPQYMPLPIMMAHKIVRALDTMRSNKELSYLRPDGKSQITVLYEDYKPVKIEKIVVAVPHQEEISEEQVKEDVYWKVIVPLIEEVGLPYERSDKTYIVNGTGKWVIGGPHSDTGLTGRKIIVDTYGGMARHGGGAFSGKDPSKVDRSGAYAARYVAKNVVAAGLADRCEVQLAYVIGKADPVSVMVETFGTNKVENSIIEKAVRETFDLTPWGIINTLDLIKPKYQATAAYGHFGREEDGFTWEKLDKVDALKKYL